MARTVTLTCTSEQRRFFDLVLHDDEATDVGYGGARGGNKTGSGCIVMLLRRLQWPGSDGLCLRKTEKATVRNLKDEFQKWARMLGLVPGADLVWHEQKKTFTLFNGSTIELGSVWTSESYQKLIGLQYTDIWWEEAVQHTREDIAVVNGSCRTDISGCVPKKWYTCVDKGEVLTETGWKPIQDVQVGELVLSMDANGVIVKKPVTHVTKAHYEGDLVEVDKRSLYMSMTPNHRVVYDRGWFGKDIKIKAWDKHKAKKICILRRGEGYEATGYKGPTFGLTNMQFMALLGIFIAEGSCRINAKQGVDILVTQCDDVKTGIVKSLFDSLGLPYTYHRCGDFQLRAFPERKALYEYLVQLGKARDKHVPREVLETASFEELSTLFSWMVHGDGSRNGKTGIMYFTASPKLANDVCEIGVKLGYRVQLHETPSKSLLHAPKLTVYLAKKGQRSTLVDKQPHMGQVKSRPHNGPVYCLTVKDTESFFLRQNGKVWVSGNTNPGGPGHMFLFEDFVDPDTRKEGYRWVQSTLRNALPTLVNDPGYMRRVTNGLPEYKRKQWIDGDWKAMAGQYFEGIDEIVCEAGDPDGLLGRYANRLDCPGGIPYWATWYAGVDYGDNAPFACLFAAEWNDPRDNTDHVHFVREIYQRRVDVDQQAREALQMERDLNDAYRINNNVIYYGDPAISSPIPSASSDTDRSVKQLWARYGWHVIPSSRILRTTGWQQMRMLMKDKVLTISPTGCPAFLKELRNAAYEKPESAASEDISKKADDHALTAASYYLRRRIFGGYNSEPERPYAQWEGKQA